MLEGTVEAVKKSIVDNFAKGVGNHKTRLDVKLNGIASLPVAVSDGHYNFFIRDDTGIIISSLYVHEADIFTMRKLVSIAASSQFKIPVTVEGTGYIYNSQPIMDIGKVEIEDYAF